MIWLNAGPVVVHTALLGEFQSNGITGYRTTQATVYFRDGSVSQEYSQITVVGWAGIARPESGVQLIEKCPGCELRRYSGMESAENLIDWNQWSGDDFFLEWPLVNFILVTKRVVDLLSALKVKSYRVASLRKYENRNLPVSYQGFTVGRLSMYMPSDVAIKYGQPYGLA
jgi:hypothetical protein